MVPCLVLKGEGARELETQRQREPEGDRSLTELGLSVVSHRVWGGGVLKNKHLDPTLLPLPGMTQLPSADEDKWKPDIMEACWHSS